MGAVKDVLAEVADLAEWHSSGEFNAENLDEVMDWAGSYRGDIFSQDPQESAHQFLAWRKRKRPKRAYMPGTRDPNGWDLGKITPQRVYQNTGSQTPIAHDRDGKPLEVEGGGMMKIPGYEWHDKSPEFHKLAKRVASRYRVKA